MAHWDGDTLVVDVTDLMDKSWLDSARHTHSDALHVVERYTRTGPKTPLRYEATIEDPKTYSRPWKIEDKMPLHRNNEPGFELREQECTEGDNGRAIHPTYRPAAKGIRWSLCAVSEWKGWNAMKSVSFLLVGDCVLAATPHSRKLPPMEVQHR